MSFLSLFWRAACVMCMEGHVRAAVESHVISITQSSTTGHIRLRHTFTTNEDTVYCEDCAQLLEARFIRQVSRRIKQTQQVDW